MSTGILWGWVAACRREVTDGAEGRDTAGPEVGLRDPRFDGVVDTVLAELGPNLAEGVSIAVRERGTLVWVEGFGSAEVGAEVPVTADTRFEIGSTTKQLTAALLLQQVQAGRMSLDDTVSDVLPELSLPQSPDWAREATLHQLLSHQGGVLDFVDWAGSDDDADLAGWHYGDFSRVAWANNPPGAFYNYSNPNFTVAGLAIEAHDPHGRAFPDVMVEDLLGPLGLDATTLRRATVADGALPYATSTGVSPLSDEVAPVPMEEVPDPAAVRPAGLVWSTPTDLTTWGSFLMHGDPAVLDDGLRAGITTAHVPTLYHGAHESYGYGVFVWDQFPTAADEWYPIRVWEHGGNTLSMTSVLVMLPDHDVTISILSNGQGDDWTLTLEGILRAVVDPFPAPTGYTPPFDPTDLARHAGTYTDVHNLGDLVIAEGGAHGLTLSVPLLDAYGYTVDADLEPISTDVWVATIDGAPFDLTFVSDPETGEDRWLRNRVFVGERDAGAAARRAPPDPETVAAALRAPRPGPPPRRPR